MASYLTSEKELSNELSAEAFNRNKLICRKALLYDLDSGADCASIDERALRVLVVDDERDTTDGLVWLIRHWGHAASFAYDGATAVKLAVAERPDVVLLDIAMPDMNGYDVSRQLRAHISRTAIFIIAITGRADHRHRQQCIEAGIDLFLIKPLAPSVLETLLLLEFMRGNRQRSRQTDQNHNGFPEIGGLPC